VIRVKESSKRQAFSILISDNVVNTLTMKKKKNADVS